MGRNKTRVTISKDRFSQARKHKNMSMRIIANKSGAPLTEEILKNASLTESISSDNLILLAKTLDVSARYLQGKTVPTLSIMLEESISHYESVNGLYSAKDIAKILKTERDKLLSVNLFDDNENLIEPFNIHQEDQQKSLQLLKSFLHSYSELPLYDPTLQADVFVNPDILDDFDLSVIKYHMNNAILDRIRKKEENEIRRKKKIENIVTLHGGEEEIKEFLKNNPSYARMSFKTTPELFEEDSSNEGGK